MNLILCLVTNSPSLARLASACMIERIVLDLEQFGKAERQAGKNLFLSQHRLSDIQKLRPEHNGLMVRTDPWNSALHEQVDIVVSKGVDRLMLPYFMTLYEVEQYLKLVDRRAKVSLLVETKEALALLPTLCQLDSVDEIHLGLNDLMLSFGNITIFDLIDDGTVENAIKLIKSHGKRAGFGGLTHPNQTDLPISPLLMLRYQVQLGCDIAWLGRSFRNTVATDDESFRKAVEMVRAEERNWRFAQIQDMENCKAMLFQQIREFREHCLSKKN